MNRKRSEELVGAIFEEETCEEQIGEEGQVKEELLAKLVVESIYKNHERRKAICTALDFFETFGGLSEGADMYLLAELLTEYLEAIGEDTLSRYLKIERTNSDEEPYNFIREVNERMEEYM